METPQPPQREISSESVDEFINALQRVFKIAMYYPTGHDILDRVTDKFMKLLTELAGENQSVMVQLYRDTIIVEGIKLEAEAPYVRQLAAMLSTLGIAAFSIDTQISMAEIHEFVRKMTAYKAKVQSARQFTQVDVSNLPHSVNVVQKEFLARAASPFIDGDTDPAENLESFIESLSKHGLNDGEIEQCRTLLDTLPEQLNDSSMDIDDLPYASWDDVARLLTRTIRGGPAADGGDKPDAPPQANVNALASILKGLEKETRDAKSREALNLLFAVLKKPDFLTETDASEKEVLTRKSYPDKPQFTVAQIQGFADKHSLKRDILEKLPQSQRDTETLSILMQLVHFEQSLANQMRMQQLFRDTLSKSLSEKTWSILSNGLHSLARTGNKSKQTSTIRLLTEPIRRSTHNSTLHLFQQTLRLCDSSESRLLWPHVVNELLVVGCGKDKMVYHSLCQFAAKLPNEEMTAMLPQLRNLEAFQETRFASDIFHAVSPSCYSLFAFLLKTEIERYIGERVLGGFRRNPKDWLIKGVVPLLDIANQEHKLFLYSYLRHATQKTLSTPLKKIAAKIVAESLPAISQEKKSEKWVENTIAAMGQLPGDKITELLRQIAGGKKLLFLPDWPANCRTAAEKALAGRSR